MGTRAGILTNRLTIGPRLVNLPRPLSLTEAGRGTATVACLSVALIWGSSLVLTKEALQHVEPLTLAGLRYSLGSLVVLPFALRRSGPRFAPVPNVWIRLFIIGIVAYGIGNTAIFAAMKYLPATTGSFALGLLPVVVLLAGWAWLGETPGRTQICGVAVAVLGVALFFGSGLRLGHWMGITLLIVGVAGNAARSVLGRQMASHDRMGPLNLTAYPLAFGGAVTLIVALVVEGIPQLPGSAWGTILCLAIVNTAAAYALFNYALCRLRAFEVNVLLNLVPFVTAGLSWTMFGEIPTLAQMLGMVALVGGALLVQGRSTRGR